MKKSNAIAAWTFVLLLVTLASIHVQAKVHSGTSLTPQKQKAATKTAKSYACPMHPEVKSNKPGKCAKCKMDLRLVSESASSMQTVRAGDTVAKTATAEVNVSSAADVGGNGMGPTKKLSIPDVEVLDQEGNALHFYSDLIKGKTVAINFIFTNCTTICPPLAATFARVQREMGDKVGKDVHLISISVDPLTDTPERLKAWGVKFKAGAGWTFVTGTKPEMDRLLNALGASVSRREDHTPAIIIGNDARGVWTRTYGLAKVPQIIAVIENVMAGKGGEETSTAAEVKP
jgi:cytochrome oxidase Cu insertion factor (SCO1/SenC/PrrC family)